jgi:hypothetical protein
MGREKDGILNDRFKKNTRYKDIGNRKSSENVSSGCGDEKRTQY